MNNKFEELTKQLKIVVFDIEILVRPEDIMRTYMSYYDPKQTMGADISNIISFGYQRLGQDKVGKCINMWDTLNSTTDEEVCLSAYNILKDADVIVTYYGTKFDRKFLTARLEKWGLTLPTHIKHIDMHVVSKTHFKLSSYRLDNVLRYFNLDQKLHHGQGQKLWFDVWNGDKKAQKLMSDYCAQDVEVLTNLFNRLSAYISLPKLEDWATKAGEKCSFCQTVGKLKKDGTRVYIGQKVQRFKCTNCGKNSQKTLTKVVGI